MKVAVGPVALALVLGSAVALPVPSRRQGLPASALAGRASDSANEHTDTGNGASSLVRSSDVLQARGICKSCLRPSDRTPQTAQAIDNARPSVHPLPPATTARQPGDAPLHQAAAAYAHRPAGQQQPGGSPGGRSAPASTPLLSSPVHPASYAPPGAQRLQGGYPKYSEKPISPPRGSSAASSEYGSGSSSPQHKRGDQEEDVAPGKEHSDPPGPQRRGGCPSCLRGEGVRSGSRSGSTHSAASSRQSSTSSDDLPTYHVPAFPPLPGGNSPARSSSASSTSSDSSGGHGPRVYPQPSPVWRNNGSPASAHSDNEDAYNAPPAYHAAPDSPQTSNAAYHGPATGGAPVTPPQDSPSTSYASSPRDSSANSSPLHKRAASDTSVAPEKRGSCKSCLRPGATQPGAARPGRQGQGAQRGGNPPPNLVWQPPPRTATYPHDPDGPGTEIPAHAARPAPVNVGTGRGRAGNDGTNPSRANDGAGTSKSNNVEDEEPWSPHTWSEINGFQIDDGVKPVTPPYDSGTASPASPYVSPSRQKGKAPLGARGLPAANEEAVARPEEVPSPQRRSGVEDGGFENALDGHSAPVSKRGGCKSCLRPTTQTGGANGAPNRGAAAQTPGAAVNPPATAPPRGATDRTDRRLRLQGLRQELQAATTGPGRGGGQPAGAGPSRATASTARPVAGPPSGGPPQLERFSGAPTPDNPHAFSAAHGHPDAKDLADGPVTPPYDSSSGASSPSRASSAGSSPARYESARDSFDGARKRSSHSSGESGELSASDFLDSTSLHGALARSSSDSLPPIKRHLQAQDADLLAPR